MLKPGIYEELINALMRDELESSRSRFVPEIITIERNEAIEVLSRYLTDFLRRTFSGMRNNDDDLLILIHLVNKIVRMVGEDLLNSDASKYNVVNPLKKLLSLIEFTDRDRKGSKEIRRPETSIAQTSLFTASGDEPEMVDELKNEIWSSDRIDILVSFIKFSGIRLLLNSLKEFTDGGGKLRIITTSYMGATDPKAISVLSKLKNTNIKVSYDTKRTRLHAKAYVFHRETGFSTAYVGSSNISNVAMSSGLEWNVKVTKKDLPETMKKISATFESYWNSNEFEVYNELKQERLIKAIKSERNKKSSENSEVYFDLYPFPYQVEILDKLEAERKLLGLNRNLIVAATGTGKTVISAFDYKRFRSLNGDGTNRILFVAHRKEILEQSLKTFRAVLHDNNFGDLFVGDEKTENLDNLFISVQSFNSQRIIDKTPKDYYDFIVIDEVHHAPANSYEPLLSYYQPSVLLGLTATPERSDGVDVGRYFSNRISAEIRLPEAIDRKLLCPFQYFGLSDSVDLSQVAWKKGGYDIDALKNLFVYNKSDAGERARMIVNKVHEYLADIASTKGIGFCVSVEHAEFMSNFFNAAGISSISVTGKTPAEERRNAKNKLRKGDVKFIFAVDVYNEGVDIPEINTVLFLRPTESITVFLQQLGRGLRISDNKDCLTVLDFIGQANRRYNFEEKFASLVSKSRRSIQKQVESGFVNLPRGSYIELERKARDYILNNIKKSFGVKSGLIERIRTFEEDASLELNLENFLTHYHLDPLDVYSKESFSRLCADASVRENFSDPEEKTFLSALRRISSMDSLSMIRLITNALRNLDEYDFSNVSRNEERMLNMFNYTIWGKTIEDSKFKSFRESFSRIRECKPIYDEIIELLEYNLIQVGLVEEKIDLGFEFPLMLHSNYTKDQILLALDYEKPGNIREGVKYLPNKKVDLLFVTLNKSEKDYSPTTLYDDYSINENLFHWQSQSTTSVGSSTGQRYINHEKMGSKVLLFVREYKRTIAGNAASYTFLGPVDYIKHEGSRPMNIIWQLQKSIPAKYVRHTNKLFAE